MNDRKHLCIDVQRRSIDCLVAHTHEKAYSFRIRFFTSLVLWQGIKPESAVPQTGALVVTL